MSLDTGRGRLYSGWKTVKECWEETRSTWNDAMREKFGEEFWDPLEYRVLSELGAIDRLAQVLNQAKQECE